MQFIHQCLEMTDVSPSYRLTLTDGSIVERDVEKLLVGPVFDGIRSDPVLFRKVRVEHGTVSWPGDVDLCPDVLIWQGPPPTLIHKE